MRRSEEGVLLRKKQEQWAREKEEHSNDGWFPFGSPGGGNPNKKHVARDYEAAIATVKSPAPYVRPATENVPPPQDPSTSGRLDTVATRPEGIEEARSTSISYGAPPPSSAAMPISYLPHPMMYAATSGGGAAAAAGSMQQPMEYMQQYHYAPMSAAYPYHHPAAYHSGGGVPDGAASAAGYAPYPYPPHPHMIPVHVLPAGTIPIPVPPPPTSQQQHPNGNMMTSSYSERWVADWTNPHHMTSSGGTTIEELPEEASSTVEALPLEHVGHTTTTTTVCTIQQPFAPPSFTQPRDVPHARVSPFVSAGGGGSAQPTASDERSEDEYDVYKAQILERQRLEAEQEERDRKEEERIERVRREKEEARKREEERKEEEERKREEDRQKSAQAVLDAIEKAKKEAEMMKKMRLHRHALEGREDGGGVPTIEGVDRRRVEEMRKEVDAFERARRLEAEEIARNAPSREKKDRRGMSLSRSPSIAMSYEPSVGRGGTATSDESSRSRGGAPPTAPVAAATASPFRRATSLAPASAAARRSQQAAAAAAAASPPPVPPRKPLATSTPQRSLPQQQPQSFERDAKSRFSLRGTPSPQGVTSRYAHLNQSPAPSSSASTTSTLTPGRSPSVGRPPVAPPRTRQMHFTPSMPSRDSPLSRTFHAGDKTRQSMREGVRSSGYGIGGDWLYSYSPSASRSATPDGRGRSGSGRTEATPDPSQQRRGREEERRRERDTRGRGAEEREREMEYYEDGESSPRSNETFITSPTVTATSRVDEPLIRYSAPPREEYGRGREEYGSRPVYGRERSASRPSSRQDDVDDYGRKSQIPVPLPRTRFASTSAATSITNPLFSPISTRARKMRISSIDTPTYRRENSMESSVTSNDSGASSGSEGGATEGIRKITAKERVVPAIKVDQSTEERDEVPVKMYTPRFSSRPSTPSGADRVNGGLRHYSDRMREMGTANAERLREPLTPKVQPRQSSLEPSSSLSASLRNLRMSINNLNLAGLCSDSSSSDSGSRDSSLTPSRAVGGGTASTGASPLLSADAVASPGLTRFHSRTSQYRSFNTKRRTDSQQQLLDRLVSLRGRLQDTQSYKDRPLSRQGSTLSISGAGVSRLAASP